MVYDKIYEMKEKHGWCDVEYELLIEKVGHIEKMFGTVVLDNFNFDSVLDEGNINEYLYIAIDWYIELFFEEALELSKSYDNNGELYAYIESDYLSVDLYVDGEYTELMVESGLDVYEYDVIDDYVVDMCELLNS